MTVTRKQALAATVLLAGAMAATIWFFVRFPTGGTTFALDWFGIRSALTGWQVTYDVGTSLRIPPWSAIMLLPVAALPFKAGWGLIAFLTLITVSLSLPKDRFRGARLVIAVLSLALGFLVVRTIADGNIEFLVLAGLLLLETGILQKKISLFLLGVFLISAKVQEVWILMLCLPFLAAGIWSLRKWLLTAGFLGLAVIPAAIWKGRDWVASMMNMQHRGSIMDSSLYATAGRLGLPSGIIWLIWFLIFLLTLIAAAKYCRGYSREATAFFLSASLLMAPYAAGNNLLPIYVLGAAPLLWSRRWEGVLLFGLFNMPYLLLPFRGFLYSWSASYWTLILCISWACFALRLRALRRKVSGGGALSEGLKGGSFA